MDMLTRRELLDFKKNDLKLARLPAAAVTHGPWGFIKWRLYIITTICSVSY